MGRCPLGVEGDFAGEHQETILGGTLLIAGVGAPGSGDLGEGEVRPRIRLVSASKRSRPRW